MELGIQISSVRKYLQTPEDVLRSFQKVSGIGYRNIQIQWISPDVPPEFIKDALLETKMKCVGTQDYTEDVLPQLDAIIAMNRLWGGSYVCISGIPKDQMNAEGTKAFARVVAEATKRVEGAGMVMEFHPRAPEFAAGGGAILLDILMDALPPTFQLCLDAFHVVKAGLDPAAWVRKYRGRLDLIHFKDMQKLPDGSTDVCPVGQGFIDWPGIVKACQETNVKYCFAEQETWKKDAFECLKESYDYIRTLGL